MLKKVLAILAMMYAAVSFAAVDVNKASAAELDGVKGIGPAASSRILAERKKGEFKDWRDFTSRVKGIKDAKAKKYSAQGLTVNGAAYNGEAPQAEDIKSKIEAKKHKGEKTAMADTPKK
ncbi:MAG: helix-hairpin-helix domain-containing protein [Burkholderiaceae bacterium]|nr:helix-hairpin-helix domain-containing protein [Burkholderiaceae bacterium]